MPLTGNALNGSESFLLGRRQLRALESICDTFVPARDGLPSACELGVPQAILEAISLNPRKAERAQVAQLLSLWDTAFLTALGGGGLNRFSGLTLKDRERVLLSWRDSRLVQRRAAFHALRKATLLMYYLLPAFDGRPNPAWEAIGYPGPNGPLPDSPAKSIDPLKVERDTELSCDVVVVGSGAGGGTAAGVLAASGLDVVVIEAGDYFSEGDYDGAELAGLTKMFAGGGGTASHDQAISFLEGSCLGGGTVINWTTSFRTPDDIRQEWAANGVAAFTEPVFDESLDAVCRRLQVNRDHDTALARDRIMERGLNRLGWHCDAMPRNVVGCTQDADCGFCSYGCKAGAKQSTLVTWLQDAYDAGARILTGTRVDRVLSRNGSACGVEATTVDGPKVTVKSRAVVAACGSIQTPALLKRSGLSNPNIGKHLKMHPATIAIGVFDEEVRGWEGAAQARYSDEYRYLHGNYGVKYETGPAHPAPFIVFAPWESARSHAELIGDLPYSSPIAVLTRDRDGGEVRVGRDGLPVVRYHLSDYDRRHVRKGLEGAARILEAAGAKKIFSAHAKYTAYEPGKGEQIEPFLAAMDGRGYGPGELNLLALHLMGSARMGGSPATSACSPTGETWDLPGLYVFDGSAFPSASGVNPMISIEAIAHMGAKRLAGEL